MTEFLTNNEGVILVGCVIIFIVLIYFTMYKPSRDAQKKSNAMLASLAIGDYVLTTSGFYGVVIDMDEDTVIIEFGNNRNCRIPMQKKAISQIEKSESR